MEKESAFKNFINKDVVLNISKEIAKVHPQFDSKKFNKVADELKPLEFRARAMINSDDLKMTLPPSYPQALKILVQVLKKEQLSGFTLWAFSEFIAQHGLEHFDESMQAMHELTRHFTSEFAIRPYFVKDHKKVLTYFHKWAFDKNVHVRRWVSEGSRPLLPWGLRLHIFKDNPKLSVALLEHLKYDEELYVRKSVANHLNDVAKFDATLVIKTIEAWQKNCPTQHKEKINWIKKQALRTLIKKGRPQALKLMGASSKVDIQLKNFKTSKNLYKLNDKLHFNFSIQSKSKKTQNLIVDYVIYFVKSNGSVSPKVYKLKSFDLKPKQSLIIEKNHSLKPITTMMYYSGAHFVALKINGKESSKVKWNFKTN